MKSLAHPEWPYAGTAHEWRGFVKDERPMVVAIYAGEDKDYYGAEAVRMHLRDLKTIYQKQNFGPELK